MGLEQMVGTVDELVRADDTAVGQAASPEPEPVQGAELKPGPLFGGKGLGIDGSAPARDK